MHVAFRLTGDGFSYWRTNSPEAAPNTCRRYLTSMRVFERWGIRDLAQVSERSLARFVTSRLASDEVQRHTVNGDLAALLSVLHAWAPLDKKRLAKLVTIARGARVESRRPKKRRARFLTPAQVEDLCAAAREVEPRTELAIRLAVLCGLRLCELCRVRAEDVRARVLHVRIDESLGEYGRIKTNEERSVSLCAPARELLDGREGFVFPSGGSLRRGRRPRLPHLSSDALWVGLKRARDKVGLPWVTWQILRHTRASWWAQGGAPRMKVAEWLGNSEDVVETYYIGLKEGYDPDCERMPAA